MYTVVEDSGLINIQNVKPGKQVMTHNHRYNLIEATIDRNTNGAVDLLSNNIKTVVSSHQLIYSRFSYKHYSLNRTPVIAYSDPKFETVDKLMAASKSDRYYVGMPYLDLDIQKQVDRVSNDFEDELNDEDADSDLVLISDELSYDLVKSYIDARVVNNQIKCYDELDALELMHYIHTIYKVPCLINKGDNGYVIKFIKGSFCLGDAFADKYGVWYPVDSISNKFSTVVTMLDVCEDLSYVLNNLVVFGHKTGYDYK